MSIAPGLGSANKETAPLMTELERVLLPRDRVQARQ